MKKLLEVEDLCISFSKKNNVVAGVCFSMNEGETLALVGETGSGKSVTGKAVTRLFSSNSVELKGKVLFKGTDLLRCSEKELRQVRGKEIGMIFQDPSSSLNPTLPIGLQIIENCKKGDPTFSTKAALEEAVRILDWVGIGRARERVKDYPFQLSGGMKQRVMIAIALAAKPKIIIADEPTTALDMTVQAQILEILREIQQSFKTSILLITHDLGIVSGFCDRAIVMNKGKIVETASVPEVYLSPKHPYTKSLFFNHDYTSDRPVEKNNSPFLHIKGLSKTFFSKSGEVKALDDINLTVLSGENLGVIGESGSGKSTLGKILLGIETPTKGSFAFETSLSREKDVQIIFQDPQSSLNPKMTVLELLKEPFTIHGMQKSLSEFEELLRLVSVPPDFLSRFPHELSGGEKQRVAIARAIALKPKFLICDEPTSALDQTTLTQILDLLESIREKFSLTLLLITHDLKVVRRVSSRACVMYAGVIMELASVDELYKNPKNPYTELLLSSIPSLKAKEEKKTIEGEFHPLHASEGCPFAPRCPKATDLCRTVRPCLEEKAEDHFVRCHFS